LVDKIPQIEALSAKATELDVESSKEQLAAVVTPGEILLLDLERRGGSDIKHVLAKLSESLASLRNKLKYAAKLASMKDEHQQYVRTIGAQEEKIREQTKEKLQALRERDTVQRKLVKLEAKDNEWRNKYERLRQRFTQLEHKGVAENEVQRIKIAQLQEAYKKQSLRVLKYKKKCIALRQAQAAGRTEGAEGSRDASDDDGGLEITHVPSPTRLSPLTSGSVLSRKRRAPSADVDVDSDDSSNDDAKDVELELETGRPRQSRDARRVSPRRHLDDTPGRVSSEPGSTITVRVEQVRNRGVEEGWFPDTWSHTHTISRPI